MFLYGAMVVAAAEVCLTLPPPSPTYGEFRAAEKPAAKNGELEFRVTAVAGIEEARLLEAGNADGGGGAA